MAKSEFHGVLRSLWPRLGKAEWVLLAMALLVAGGLRLQHADQLAVEHFDEGVYSADLWYSGPEGASYPGSHFYAPPLLATLIRASDALTGGAAVAPFLPSMLLGLLTVLAVWWVTRSWFGQNAGLFALFIVSLSEYHVQLSRFALTDVPALFLMLVAVGLAGFGLHHRSLGLMIGAGIATGLAWWMKYLGWLPLAIVTSGASFWWLLVGRKQISIPRLAALLLTMTAAALLTFSPWWWQLQSVGGYAAVRANHGAYVTWSTSTWQEHLASHIMYQFRFDSWAGACSVAIGLLAAANRRWIDLARFTWNDGSDREPKFPSRGLLLKFVATAVILGIIALGISTIGLLTCLGVGGLAGIFLWRTLSTLHERCQGLSKSDATDPADVPLTGPDCVAAPQIDPMIGTCLVTAWLVGLLVTTPLYHPFPRLTLPLVAAIWLASAAGVSWWIEANLSVARRGISPAPLPRYQMMLRQMLTGMILGAVALTFLTLDLQQAPDYWEDRTSLRDASLHLADRIVAEVQGEAPSKKIEAAALPMTVTPDSIETDGTPVLTGLGQLLQQIEPPFQKPLPLVESVFPTAVVYTFGEPSVAAHLAEAGLHVAPVATIPDRPARLDGKSLPTFFVMGPNALRTDGFMNDWVGQQHRFRHVRDFYFAPSDMVLYNLFRPQWVSQHIEARVQKLELYELLPAP